MTNVQISLGLLLNLDGTPRLCACGCKGVLRATRSGRRNDDSKKFLCGHGRSKPNLVNHLPDGTSVLLLHYKGIPMNCSVSTSDYHHIQALHTLHWYAVRLDRCFYAMAFSREVNQPVLMHRLIRPDLPLIDHQDGNGLRNVRSNLRAATPSQSVMNRRKTRRKCSSKFIGVRRTKGKQKWRAEIAFNGKRIHLGYFDSEEAAAEIRDKAAKKLHGEFAVANLAA